ncbi:diguanylate cyclase domain-containing protein [Extibacter muris]|uniref:diguanylate cyclase domain-containing protein n=1 Tax=Extibacter muris TaxID=1796622 RepID=UPI001D0930FA|nr:diguanylate cyclase [Extibacter muris]MCB6203959.1 diguanylate cyclase [Extibacter muris]MCQ4665766.1 diguanylate cyclase [Extibacter muris]MCQ4695245.1 diguanylate cyclase [Extibacter muris]
MEAEKLLCEMTKNLWHCYLLEPTEENYGDIIEACDKKLSMIGTGRHEIFNTAEEAVKDITDNQREARQISFDVLDEWYRAVMIREDVGIVYGGIWVREHRDVDAEALIEMNTRFTIVYALDDDKEWKMVHVHHSMPYFDQAEGEFYPKALSVKVREALELVELFKKKAEMDLMTGIYNHDSFQRKVEQKLVKEDELCFYVIDLDDFKLVNDTYGHSTGDALLKLLAKLLRENFPEHAVIGRLGGDEFAVCETCPGTKEEREERLGKIRSEYQHLSGGMLEGRHGSYSVGIAEKGNEGITYRQIYEKADEALYLAKQFGKDQAVLPVGQGEKSLEGK